MTEAVLVETTEITTSVRDILDEYEGKRQKLATQHLQSHAELEREYHWALEDLAKWRGRELLKLAEKDSDDD